MWSTLIMCPFGGERERERTQRNYTVSQPHTWTQVELEQQRHKKDTSSFSFSHQQSAKTKKVLGFNAQKNVSTFQCTVTRSEKKWKKRNG